MKGDDLIPKLSQELYLEIVGLFCMVEGFVLFISSIYYSIPILSIKTYTNPLFWLILGISILGIRYFFKIVDKKEKMEVE